MEISNHAKKYDMSGMFGMILFLAASVCILGFSSTASVGAYNGLVIVSTVIIPSIFPFTVASIFLIKSGGITKISQIFEKVSYIIFGITGNEFAVMIISLLGGYPIGAKMASELYKGKGVTYKEAVNLLKYSVNPSPAFVITVIGEQIIGNKPAGVMLFFANLIACFLLNFISGIFIKNKKSNVNNTCYLPLDLSTAFVESVKVGAATIVNISAWVVLFSSVASILKSNIWNGYATKILFPLLEISFGATELGKTNLPICFYSFFLAFGGLSTLCQVKSAAENIKISFLKLISYRILHGCVATIISYLLFKAFPISLSVMNNSITAAPYSPKLFLPSVVLLVFAAAFLMFINQKPKRQKE